MNEFTTWFLMLLRQLRLLLTFLTFPSFATSFKNTVHQTSYGLHLKQTLLVRLLNASKPRQSILQMNPESAHLRRHPQSVLFPVQWRYVGSGGSAEEIEFHVFLRDPVLHGGLVHLPRKKARNGIAPTLQLTK